MYYLKILETISTLQTRIYRYCVTSGSNRNLHRHKERLSIDRRFHHRIPVWLAQSIEQASSCGSDESGVALYQLKRSLLLIMGGRMFLSLLTIIAWAAGTGKARKLSLDPLFMISDEIQEL